MLRIFMPVKIKPLRPGLNPQTWVPEASMLTTRPPKPSISLIRNNLACWRSPISMVTRSKAWVCGCPLARIVGSNSAQAWVSIASALCCQVEVSASGWSLVQRSRTECSVSDCDHGTSKMRGPCPTAGLSSHENKNLTGFTLENSPLY